MTDWLDSDTVAEQYEERFGDGVFHVTKNTGMFVARE
ncbi:hypothetical protein SAMN05421858_1391 [Haladaptatus litoreus]|uniref:Uncharacterized protein n=1 Tax=Haladaptatus litoreus TaxID=553468 RepID=A0A1N6Y4B2_9EURY|nr:hypothetical protein SAMN05421858_1391 [Haladaptatus litoreus]